MVTINMAIALPKNSMFALADRMSCQAVNELTLQHWDKDQGVLDRNLENPSDHFCQMVDRGQMYNKDLSRRLCFTHDPAFKAGPYFSQLENVRQESYEEWTRRKDLSGPYQASGVGPQPAYDLDWAFFNCPGTAVGAPCFYNIGTGVVKTTCPAKCKVFPSPCPNPISSP